MDGVLVIDKPLGLTSHDVVQRVRRWAGQRRVGHLGTLDPGATGVLPVALGEATKLSRLLTLGRKGYEGRIRLGIETETYDREGKIVAEYAGPWPERPHFFINQHINFFLNNLSTDDCSNDTHFTLNPIW